MDFISADVGFERLTAQAPTVFGHLLPQRGQLHVDRSEISAVVRLCTSACCYSNGHVAGTYALLYDL